jgi:hypothetical protein
VSAKIIDVDHIYGGTLVLSRHNALARRDSFDAGIEDATCQALSYFNDCHRHILRGTALRYLPHHRSGDVASRIAVVRVLGTSKQVYALAYYMAAVVTDYDAALEELCAKTEEIDHLRAMVAGIPGEDPREPELEAVAMPPRSHMEYRVSQEVCRQSTTRRISHP